MIREVGRRQKHDPPDGGAGDRTHYGVAQVAEVGEPGYLVGVEQLARRRFAEEVHPMCD